MAGGRGLTGGWGPASSALPYFVSLSPVSDRRASRHQATRQQIIDAAWALARERGLTGWTLREVADAVGMRAPSLYVYFEHKDAIYDAMFAQGYAQLLEAIDATPTTGEPLRVLRRVARTFLAFCVADQARFQLLFLRVLPGFTPSPESYALAEEVLDRLRRMLADAGIRGRRSVDLWTALMTGLAAQQLSNDPGGDRWTRLANRAVEMFLASELPERDAASRG